MSIGELAIIKICPLLGLNLDEKQQTMIQKLSEQEQKIAQLIYTGKVANDLLALELMKHLGISKNLFPLALGVVIYSEENTVKKAYAALLSRQMSEGERSNLEEFLRPVYFQQHLDLIKRLYAPAIRADIAYVFFERKKDLTSCFEFLRLSDKDHSERKKVFQYLCAMRTTHHKSGGFRRRELSLTGLFFDEIQLFMDHIGNKLNSLERLFLTDLKENKIPESLFKPSIKELRLQNFQLEEFPSAIFGFSEIEKLTLWSTNIEGLPTDWSAFGKLKKLHFYKNNYLFEDFDFTDSLPQLEQLYLGQNRIKNPYYFLRKKKIPILDKLNFASYEPENKEEKAFYPRIKDTEFLSIASALGKSVLTKEEQKRYLEFLTSVKTCQELPVIPLSEMLLLMNVNYSALRAELQNRINEFITQQKGGKTLKAGANLYILGTPKEKKTVLKEQLLDIGINVVTKPNEKISHVLLGANPKKCRDLEGLKFQLVQLADVQRLLTKEQPKFLEKAAKEGDTRTSEKVLRLIQNEEPATVLLGLQMLQSGGVPPEMLEPLLVLQKTYSDSKARGVAKKLLEQNAPSDWLPIINDKFRFTNILTGKAQDINKKFKQLAENISPYWAATLSIMFHKRYKKGLRYILYHYKKPCQERTLAFDAMVQDNHFDFHSALGFTDNRKKDPEQVVRYNTMTIPAKFPLDIVDYYPNLESADFHNCKLKSIPTGIRNFKKLKHLDLSSNYLSKLPKGIEQCVELETIELYLNDFSEFPMSLAKLPKLKKIDLRYNGENYSFETVEVPQEVRDALPECEILV